MELSSQLDPSVVLNVNAPNEPEWKVKGTRLTSTGDRTFIDHLMHEDDDRESLAAPNSNGANGANGTSDDDKPKKKAVSIKEGYYSYHGVAQDFTGLTDEADLVALHDGYATITPLLTDITDIKSLRRMKYPKIDTTLVLFIDFQNDIIDKMRKPDQLRNNAVKFAKCMEHLGAFPIMAHRRTSENGLAFKPLRKALGKFERIDRLDMDCFGNAGFEEVIDEKDPARVVIAGVEAHLSVLQTALSFRERGYEVIVIKDCCASAKKEDLETAMDLLAANGCTVTTYEAFAYYMLGRSGKTTYGAIERIVSDPE